MLLLLLQTQCVYLFGPSMAGHFNLSHDQYETTATETLKSLATDKDFTDVTLACAGDRLVKAHKVILGSYSPVLKNIIVSVQQQNPVLYLRGVEYEELRAIINFIYLGETKVKQDNFAAFMEIAQELNIKGLAANAEGPDKMAKDVDIPPESEREDSVKNKDYDLVDDIEHESVKGNLVKTEQMLIGTDELELETEAEKNVESFQDKAGYWCSKCGKDFSDKSNLSRHVRSQHDGVTYSCDMCDYIGKQSTNLNYHKKSKHSETNPFACPKCDKTFSDGSNLGRHIKSQHEGVVYPCNVCEYKAKQTTQLKAHIKSRHGVLDENADKDIKT